MIKRKGFVIDYYFVLFLAQRKVEAERMIRSSEEFLNLQLILNYMKLKEFYLGQGVLLTTIFFIK